MSQDRALNAFLRQYLDDRASGKRRALEEYLALFPGYEGAIAEHYARYERDDGGDAMPLRHAGRAEFAGTGWETVGPYRISSELGRGGQAVVYAAEDTRLRRRVALKVLKGFGVFSASGMERFRREAEVTSRLDHPGICAVYDTGIDGGTPYIAMRLVQGTTLATRIAAAKRPIVERFEITTGEGAEHGKPDSGRRRSSGLSTTQQEIFAIVELIEKTALALHVAHEAGVVHRDMKPGNVMVTTDGQPVILDFGLASDAEGDYRTLTQSGDLCGTPAYMSPEQLTAHRISVDRRSDVYSLGVTLFECLTLQRPFDAPTRDGMYQAIQFKEPPDIRQLNNHVPRDLKVVVECALQKDRDKRYATALAFAEDLRRVRASEPIAARAVGPLGRIARFAKRRPAAAALIGVLALAVPTIAGLGGFLVANWDEIDQQRTRAAAEQIERHLENGYLELADDSPERAIAFFDQALALNPRSTEAVAGKARALLNLKRPQEALVVIDARPAGLDSDDALRMVGADALDASGRTKEAEHVRRALSAPSTHLASFLAGQRELASADAGHNRDRAGYRRAVLLLEDAVARTPTARLLYHGALSRAAAGAKDWAVARRILAALERLWPDRAAAWHHAGYAWHAMEDWAACERASRRAIEIAPNHAKAHNNLATALLKTGRPEEALEVLTRADRIDPRLSAVHANSGLALALLGRREESLAAYRRAIEADPKNPLPRNSIGKALIELGRLDEAIIELRRAVEIDPLYAAAHTNLGKALQDEGLTDEALAASLRAIEADPELALAHSNVGISLNRKGRTAEAKAAFERAIELDPELANAHNALSQLIAKEGRIEEAMAGFRRAIEIDPRLHSAHYNLGFYLAKQGRNGDAIVAYRRALELKPEYAPAHLGLGTALKFEDRIDDAIDAYRRALELEPKVPKTHFHLATALRQKGFLDEAIAEFRRAIDLGLDAAFAASAHENLAWCMKHKGRVDAAISEYQRALEIDPGHAAARKQIDIATTGMIGYERTVDRILAGGPVPEDPGEAVQVAFVASGRDLHALAVRLWTTTFGRDPDLEAKSDQHWLDRAGRSAVIAGSGGGQDGSGLGPEDRARLRGQGLRWLTGELDFLWTTAGDGDAVSAARRRTRWALERWKSDPALASVRDPAQIAKLPEQERDGWKTFWADVDAKLANLGKERGL